MSQSLRASLTKIGVRIDTLTLRERALIFFSTLAVLFFVANSLVLTPMFKSNQQYEQLLSARQAQAQQLEMQMQSALNSGQSDVDAEQNLRLKALRAQLMQHDPAQGGATRKLIPPTEMVTLVEQILSHNRALQVIHIENLAPESLDGSGSSTPTANTPATGIYRHGMQIELRGRYVDIVNYLHELEALPWKMYWGRFTLLAEDYPNSRMTLIIYTLSLRPGWMGT